MKISNSVIPLQFQLQCFRRRFIDGIDNTENNRENLRDMLSKLRKDPMDDDLEKCDGEYFPCEFCGDPYPVEFIMRHQVVILEIFQVSFLYLTIIFYSCHVTWTQPQFRKGTDLIMQRLLEEQRQTWHWQTQMAKAHFLLSFFFYTFLENKSLGFGLLLSRRRLHVAIGAWACIGHWRCSHIWKKYYIFMIGLGFRQQIIVKISNVPIEIRM